MTDVEDLDSFIKQQKEKIARDRQAVGTDETQQGKKQLDNNEETGLALEGYKYEEKRKNLLNEKQKEYNDIIAQKNTGKNVNAYNPTEETGLKLDGYGYEEKRKNLLLEKKKEYNAQSQKVKTSEYKENLPPDDDPKEPGIIAKLGSYEDKKRRLQEERKREYNLLLAQKEIRRTGGQPQEKPAPAPITAIPQQSQRDRPSAQERKRREMEAFKEFLRTQKQQQVDSQKSAAVKPYSKHDGGVNDEAPRLPDSDLRDNEAYLASLPGLRDHPSAEVRKMAERNREYNELLQMKKQPRAKSYYPDSGDEDRGRPAPRRGWATPTYDELLEKKRKEEKNYRRYNDPSYEGMRSSRSENNLNRPAYDPEERYFRNLDREYEQKKVRFRNDNVYGDPQLEFSDWEPRSRSQVERRAPPATRYDPPPPSRYDDPGHRSARQPDVPAATLAIGHEKTMSADQRRKEMYRRELQQQMAQDKQYRDRERKEDLRVNATGAYDVGRRPDRQQLPDRQEPTQYPYSPRDPHPGDRPPPPSVPHPADFGPRGPQGRVRDSGGILENGFAGLYEPYHLAQPSAPRPLSQPNMPPPLSYRAPLDDAYTFYANRHPLDTQLGLGGVGLDAGPASDRPKVTFNTSRPEVRRDTAPATTAFPVEDKAKPSKDSQRAYQEELKRQMEEQRQKKQKEKEERERYERKLEAEIANYDPFGRGGGGAPLKDGQGNVIADLREMHSDNKDTKKSLTPRQPPPSVNLDPYKTSPDKDTFERGGHGIFGDPITDVEKLKRERYQDELRQQMEEKKRQQEAEKERQRLEDEKLLRKIEEDNRRMQEELQAERNKERAKQEEAQRQQEELRRQQEEKRKEEERKAREADEKRQDDLRRQEAERRRQREEQDRQRQRANSAAAAPTANHRSSSPPIPTLKAKTAKQEARSNSPPIPAMRSKTEPPASPPLPAQKTQSRQSRAASADVLNQLARMRQQLQSERKRVESDLKKEQEEPEVFDPRLHKPQTKPNVDVFEVARNKEPVAVRRQTSAVNPKNVQDFQSLKHRAGTGRSDFRKLFPVTPQSNDGLETQQRVLLDHQAGDMDDLRKRRNLNKMNPKDLGLQREGSVISAALLESDSAFIDIPEDERTSSSRRNPSARNRHRLRSDTPKSDQFGSVVSLDPDKITQKNDERLRRLKSIASNHDDVSLASADADDILDRFMAKQQHTRPPSGQTLVDDSWLRPGTRVT